MGDTIKFAPGFGRVLAVVVVLLCAIGAVFSLASGGSALLNLAPLVFIGTVAWALYFRPAVIVSDGDVTLRNVFRTIEIPWTALDGVETQYALTLFADGKRYSAWAAPAPGLLGAIGTHRSDLRSVPETAKLGDSARPADNPRTESGSAALIVRRRWEDLQHRGHLSGAREADRPRAYWHRTTIAALLVLAAATAISLLSA